MDKHRARLRYLGRPIMKRVSLLPRMPFLHTVLKVCAILATQQ